MRSAPATFRLLLVSVVLPAVFVAIDQAALRFGAANRWSPATGVTVGSWFVVQTALLSFLAGSKLPHWGWRLLLLGWSLVLVNLLNLLAGRQLDVGKGGLQRADHAFAGFAPRGSP
ncbi:MAG TPA: hypothetical protein PK867_17520 [Pirellulales bacterium]|nr:hypothetical protein [Pirellulales bacterium]